MTPTERRDAIMDALTQLSAAEARADRLATALQEIAAYEQTLPFEGARSYWKRCAERRCAIARAALGET